MLQSYISDRQLIFSLKRKKIYIRTGDVLLYTYDIPVLDYDTNATFADDKKIYEEATDKLQSAKSTSQKLKKNEKDPTINTIKNTGSLGKIPICRYRTICYYTSKY